MRTHLNIDAVPPPEAMADVPGVCELSLTRAVVQYRGLHEGELEGGRIQDIGLALVLEGRYAAAAEGIDLGSGEVKKLDLSTELVVLDWVYEPTLEHVAALLKRVREHHLSPAGLQSYLFDLALHVLRRSGFGPLTRPVLLRIGFRDICRDLDLHEGTSVRIRTGRGRLLGASFDYDGCALVVRTMGSADPKLADLLARSFPGGDVHRERVEGAGEGRYQIRFPFPLNLAEVRGVLEDVRSGLSHLLALFEPQRYRALSDLVETLGARSTLARLQIEGQARSAPPLVSESIPAGSERAH